MRIVGISGSLRARSTARLYLAVFLLVLAPIAAVVIITLLLVFHVTPHTVFAPGFAVKSLIERGGVHVPNGVGVVSTVLFWWVIVSAIGLLWERRRR